MEKFEPVNSSYFSGLIAKHQLEYDTYISYQSNDYYYIDSPVHNISRMFNLNAPRPSAFSTKTPSIVIDINFKNNTFLLTHYQMQQRTDDPIPSGCFTDWIVKGRSDKIGWKNIDSVSKSPCITKAILLRETKNMLLNQIRFTFFAKHITIQQIDFYGVLGNFSGYDDVYQCQSVKMANVYFLHANPLCIYAIIFM